MPEGDTIYVAANRLRKTLRGQAVTVTSSIIEPAPIDGKVVDLVESRGKHLLIHFDGDHVVHTHLGMKGAWHFYAPDEPWRKSATQAAISLRSIHGTNAVCFLPKTIELLTTHQLRRHRWLSRLGPDILAEPFDLERILSNLYRQPGRPIGAALLDQTIVMGIGNVYKSELLFLQRLHPFRATADFPKEALTALMLKANQLMRANLDGRPRRTRFGRDGSRSWVYGRSGQPCFQCGTNIRMQRQGDLGRSTYWCPECQDPVS